MNIYLLCIGLLALLTISMGILVSVGRAKFNVIIGHSTDAEDTLHKRVRAHGNTAEYAPLLIILIYLVSLNEPANWVCWFTILVTVCRFVYIAGILFPATMAKPNPMRFVGALGTYIFGLGLCYALIVQALNA